MGKKTSIHVCAAKYGAEKHNRREKEMKHVHSEYSHLNKTWESSDFKSVADEIRKAKERYSAKHFCRKAKLGEDGKQLTIPAIDSKTGNPIVDPATGLQKMVPAWEPDLSKPKKLPKNAEPIREGVAVITEATTMEQMHELANAIRQRYGIDTKAIYAHLDEGHEHVVTDKDHEKGKYLDVPEGKTIMIWNYHAHYIFDWTDHNTGQCINLNRHDMSELQDMLANTFKMERGKKSDKKWRDAHTYKAEQEAIRAKEVAEFTERKKAESKQIIEAIKENSNKLTKLQKAIDDLLSATSVPEESLDAVPFAEMTFTMKGSDEVKTVQDLVGRIIKNNKKSRKNDNYHTYLPFFLYLCVKRQYICQMTKDINRIKVVLVEKKRTGKWLAEQIGKDPATISKWCTNTSQPDLRTLIEIASCLQVDIKELINSTKES